MHNLNVFLFLLTVILIQTILSFEIINNELDYVPSLPTDTNPNCLSKDLLSSVLHRNRRASISRPYFHPRAGSRDDNNRQGSKSVLAFSPRLGKRSYNDENEFNNFIDYLQKKQIDVVYEDQTKICFSQIISDTFIQNALNKFHTNQYEQNLEEQRFKNKYPLLFRYYSD
ncbi:unnamed protein product [Adineta steineri]|uniref:Uncharacterized protein n=1 Tax=Adineta steineri TaxID=433720 RepID=A0A814R1J7_9BILA|nr:unnamed protein product [Adineta steineri]